MACKVSCGICCRFRLGLRSNDSTASFPTLAYREKKLNRNEVLYSHAPVYQLHRGESIDSQPTSGAHSIPM